MAELSRAESIYKVRELLQDTRICMLTTLQQDGTLHSRPMALQQAPFDGDLWFFTQRSSGKAAELAAKRVVSVTAQSADLKSFLALRGFGYMVVDEAKNAALWNPAYTAWFPKGLNDPELALLRVETQTAEYWASPGGVVTYLYNLVTGGRSDEHARLEL